MNMLTFVKKVMYLKENKINKNVLNVRQIQIKEWKETRIKKRKEDKILNDFYA